MTIGCQSQSITCGSKRTSRARNNSHRCWSTVDVKPFGWRRSPTRCRDKFAFTLKSTDALKKTASTFSGVRPAAWADSIPAITSWNGELFGFTHAQFTHSSVPSAKNWCFHTGSFSFIRSTKALAAAKASPRCELATATTSAASPSGISPIR